MRPSLILKVGARYMQPLLLLASIFLMSRGHNDPGGGFVGGLVASTGFGLLAFADGVAVAKRALYFDTRSLIPLGLACALGSGIIAFFFGKPFMTGYWLPFDIPIFNHFGVPGLFDLGVYFAVLGVTLTIIFNAATQKE